MGSVAETIAAIVLNSIAPIKKFNERMKKLRRPQIFVPPVGHQGTGELKDAAFRRRVQALSRPGGNQGASCIS